MATTTNHVYRIFGMSCAHCRVSVMAEVEEIDGVIRAQLDLDSVWLQLESVAVTADHVRSAVERAGYELAEIA